MPTTLQTLRTTPKARVGMSARRLARGTAARATRRVVCSSNLDGKIEEAIKEAEEACEGGVSGECAAAWDSVEELSAEASHKRSRAKADPLEEFCESNPDSDECRVYDD
mmetsp:Transcript_4778/g.30245  ORF Transcript_4778/g.30245 Transcript_4778/m.30245 type:complete len:109 (+) Transcript_4778:486-812(+)